MNILVLCLSPGKGGLELYAHRSTEIIEELGYKSITVYNPESCIFKTQKSDSDSTFSLKISFHLFPLVSALKLARIIDINNIDIINIHWSRDFNVAVFAKIFSSRNVKLIYTRHMAITRHKSDFYHKFLYNQVDRFVVITKQLQHEAIHYLPIPKSKIKLLYHGVKIPDLNDVNCKKFKLDSCSPNNLHVAIFSRIEEGKGQHLLVEAVHTLKIQNKEIHVTVIGHVMDEKYFQRLKQSIDDYELHEQFHFHQFIENASLSMTCFDVVVLTTYAETFGLVLIEAMQSGVAVIGSEAGGVPEIIEDNVSGLLFESGNADALAEKIELMYDNIEFREQLAREGQQRAADLFSEQQHSEALNQILIDVYNEA